VSNSEFHWSDCAIHNGPAYPSDVCDCTQADPEYLRGDLANPDVYKVGLVRALLQEARIKEKELCQARVERIFKEVEAIYKEYFIPQEPLQEPEPL